MHKKDNPFTYKTPKEATGLLLYQAFNRWQREIKRSLKEFDLTHTQFVILANAHWLLLQDDEVTQIEIAQQAKMDVMMTSNVIRTLEKKGVIIRKEHKTDARSKLVELTPKGLTTLKKAVKRVEDFDQSFFGNLENASLFNQELISLMDSK